jgi:hypothetical protein
MSLSILLNKMKFIIEGQHRDHEFKLVGSVNGFHLELNNRVILYADNIEKDGCITIDESVFYKVESINKNSHDYHIKDIQTCDN